MAIRAAVCDAYVCVILRTADVFKIALYTPSASLSRATKVYTPDGEVSSPGYTPGGLVLHGYEVGQDGRVHWATWTTAPTWRNLTCATAGALIYNASQGNCAVAVLEFGETLSPAGVPFTVELPPAGAGAALHVSNLS